MAPLYIKEKKIALKYLMRINIFFKRFYLFIFRERGKEGERGKERSMCGCLSCGPHWGPGLQPRHVPWLGIKLVTLWFTACAQSTELHQPGLNFFLIWFLHIWLLKFFLPVEIFLTFLIHSIFLQTDYAYNMDSILIIKGRWYNFWLSLELTQMARLKSSTEQCGVPSS